MMVMSSASLRGTTVHPTASRTQPSRQNKRLDHSPQYALRSQTRKAPMFTFTDENEIIFHTGTAKEVLLDFNSERELLELADAKGVSRDGLQAVYDGLVAEGLAEPCKRLRNRPYAVSAIWKAIQAKDPNYKPAKVQPEQMFNGRPPKMAGPVPVPVAPKDHKRKATAPEAIAPAPKPVLPTRKTTKASKSKPSGNDRAKERKPQRAGRQQKEGEFRPGTKAAEALSMLKRKEGVSNAELVEKLGWQKHTVRGFMSTLGSKHKIKVKTQHDEQRGLVYKTV